LRAELKRRESEWRQKERRSVAKKIV
jgi:hypothetical protein